MLTHFLIQLKKKITPTHLMRKILKYWEAIQIKCFTKF